MHRDGPEGRISMAGKGKIWGLPPMSGGPFRHYPPGGTTSDPVPAYTRSDNPNVTFDFKPEGNNDDAVARMHGLPVHEDAPLKTKRLNELRSFVRQHNVKWHKSQFNGKWYRDDEPLRGFAGEVDLLLDVAGRLVGKHV